MSTPAPDATADHRPLRRDAERNRQRILQAAREVFAERGLGVTLDEIARHAGVGVGTVYRRFADKEALIDALFEDRIGELVAIAEQALTEDDAWEGLLRFLDRSLAMQSADRGLKDVITSSTHGHDRVAQARARMAPLVTQLVHRAQAAGELRADLEPTDVPVITLLLALVADFTSDVVPELWRRYLTIVLDGLRTRREGPSPLPVDALDLDELGDAMRSWRPPPR